MSGRPSLERPAGFPAGAVPREQLVTWLRSQPDQAPFLRACYQDQPELEAADRFFSSEEWQATLSLLPAPTGRALDLGSGNGIAAYALARSGWQAVAVEPSSSPVTGAGAVSSLLRTGGLEPAVVVAVGERLPFPDASFDVVYSRQVIHHVGNAEAMCRELRRVLRPGGTYLACAEHVVSNERQRRRFLMDHPMHHFTQDENAFRLERYRRALQAGGLEIVRVLRPFDSSINTAPYTRDGLRAELDRKLAGVPVLGSARRWALGPRTYPLLLKVLSRAYRRPGRAYTFVARRP